MCGFTCMPLARPFFTRLCHDGICLFAGLGDCQMKEGRLERVFPLGTGSGETEAYAGRSAQAEQDARAVSEVLQG